MWCQTHVCVGAEMLSVASVYFLHFMVLLEIQMSSELNVEMAAPLAPTRGNHCAMRKTNECPDCHYKSNMAATGKDRPNLLEAGFKTLCFFMDDCIFRPYNLVHLR
jgi:hypothetical protein